MSNKIIKKTTPYIGSHLEPFDSSLNYHSSYSSTLYEECDQTDDLRECIRKITEKGEILTDNSRLNNLNYDASNNVFSALTLPVREKLNDFLNPKPTLEDGRTDDNNELATKENALYIIGTITMVTLFISAVMLAR